jgi:hypothetical protein
VQAKIFDIGWENGSHSETTEVDTHHEKELQLKQVSWWDFFDSNLFIRE